MTRRDFVRTAAGAVAVTAAAGAAGVALWDLRTRPADPSAAWAAAEGVDRIVLAASLAPSSHNTQPWRFRLGPDRVDIAADPARTMGAADPRLRELHLSLGCAIDNAAIAAAALGTPPRVTLDTETPGRPAARLDLSAVPAGDGADGRLAVAIPRRRTNRGPYDPERAITPALIASFEERARDGVRVVWLTGATARRRFTDLSVAATEAHVADRGIQRDSHRWYRMDRAEAEAHRDGITVSGANLPGPVALLMGLFPPTPDSFDAGWTTATRDTHCGTAPAFGLLVVDEAGDRGRWIEAGRTYQRIQLAATLAGVATHPVSQALALRDRELATGAPGTFAAGLAELAGPGEVALAFRVGHPVREQQPSLRRPPVIDRP